MAKGQKARVTVDLEELYKKLCPKCQEILKGQVAKNMTEQLFGGK